MKILETINLTKHFGGLIAISDVNITIEKNEIRGLIGPNGAGKTTFLNLITGYYKPTKGKIFFNGSDITGLPPYKIIQKGIARTFQLTNFFPEMTVFENIWLGINSISRKPWDFYHHIGSLKYLNDKVLEILNLVGLDQKKHMIAGNLSYGDRKLLEIGIALSTNPTLILLDEPMQGVSPEEKEKVVECIKRISVDKTVLIIEHDIDVILRLCKTITVLDRGKVIAGGTPNEISMDINVQRTYLGIE
jgi:branched-chain amino acid transport system ATP-binding protein